MNNVEIGWVSTRNEDGTVSTETVVVPVGEVKDGYITLPEGYKVVPVEVKGQVVDLTDAKDDIAVSINWIKDGKPQGSEITKAAWNHMDEDFKRTTLDAIVRLVLAAK